MKKYIISLLFTVCGLLGCTTFIPNAPIKSAFVNSEYLIIRAEPYESSPALASFDKGNKLEIYEQFGEWARITPKTEKPLWINTTSLCYTSDCYLTQPNKYNTTQYTTSLNSSYSKPSQTTKSRYTENTRTYSDSKCPCSGSNICIGPRGGIYCITSGGNKRYLPR